MYTKRVAEAEASIRVLWGLAPFLGGQGSNPTFEAIYQRCLENGTNPQSEEYWGDVVSSTAALNQLFCEMAAIASALLIAPDKLWHPLSDSTKNNIAKWLDSINHSQLSNNNWQFFPVLVNVAFKKLGRPEFNQIVMDRCLAAIDSYYEGDGWYRDGTLNTHDYYVAFAFHYYDAFKSML